MLAKERGAFYRRPRASLSDPPSWAAVVHLGGVVVIMVVLVLSAVVRPSAPHMRNEAHLMPEDHL